MSAATVTLGCALFVLAGDITSPALPGSGLSNPDSSSASAAAGASLHAAVASFTTVGLVLLSIFMVFDGLTCTSQDKLFASFEMHSCSQLLYTAAWSALLSAAFLVATGQMWGALAFVARHPTSLSLMLMQSAVSTTVQLFIAFTIKRYGALNFALMMTLRQFLSIIFSCLVFRHELAQAQWLGTLLVIGGLVARSVDKSKSGRRDQGTLTGGDAAEGAALLSDPKLQKQIPVIAARSPRAPPPLQSPSAMDGSPMLGALSGRPLPSVLQPLSGVFASPLRRSTLVPAFHGSGDWKEKPG